MIYLMHHVTDKEKVAICASLSTSPRKDSLRLLLLLLQRPCQCLIRRARCCFFFVSGHRFGKGGVA